ncbi:MAG: hypothetical protein ACRYFU_15375 [Janthinobacterium lividum]
MKSLRRVAIATLLAAGTVGAVQAQTASGTRHTTKAKHKTRKPAAHTVSAAMLQQQMHEMHDQLQTEIDLLKQQVAQRDAQLAVAQQTAQSAQQQAAVATTQTDAVNNSVQQNAAAVSTLQTTVQQNQTATAAVATQVQQVAQDTQVIRKAVEEPAAIHYKGITLTPGGFFAGESVWRQRAMNADMFTNFNTTPYENAGEAHVTEWMPSARGTRLSMLAAGNVPFGTISGYFEGDFLGAGSSSNNLQTNSYVLRTRQAWAQVKSGPTTFTGGQMFSLLTEDKKAAQPGQEALPLIFDYNYTVGFTYVRQLGFRLQEALSPQVTVAVAVENSQYQFSASNAPTNFFFGAVGVSSGTTNPDANYTNQVAPDVLAKVSFDPKFGHFELGGVARFFRDRTYPVTGSSLDATNNTKLGGGFVANARFKATSKATVGFHLTAGDGTGRYGVSILPDVTVHPNGTLEPIRNAQGLFSLEIHPTPKWDIFGYAGTEYAQRTTYRNATGVLVGYAPITGSNAGCNTEAVPTGATGYLPGTAGCLGATRDIAEGSAGWAYRFYSGPKGKLQIGFAYGYLTRSGWSGVGGAPKAINNLGYTSFRYYIP